MKQNLNTRCYNYTELCEQAIIAALVSSLISSSGKLSN